MNASGPDRDDSWPDIEIAYEDDPHEFPTQRYPLPHRLPPAMTVRELDVDTPVVPPDLTPVECPRCGAAGSVFGTPCLLCAGERTVPAATATAFRISNSIKTRAKT